MLTLRPTRLSGDPNRHDWTVHEDGEQIGRLYEDVNATRPENQWFWSIQVMGPARDRVQTDGRAPTLEQAKADFRIAWENFKAINVDPVNPGSGPKIVSLWRDRRLGHCIGTHCSGETAWLTSLSFCYSASSRPLS